MKRVIIVEDDLHIQDIFKIIFEMYGYEVECLENSEPLLNWNSKLPDAFIVDKNLPGRSGVEVSQFLKSHPSTRNIPVVLITATPGIEKAAALARADSFFEKPFDMHSIVKSVDSLIENSRKAALM
jgi:DNA-binding response OmpR family regulator